ncbi:C40 family peptidase [Dehalobacter sp. TBBPA1]|uniref:C40 family peptidase n=1 Tax=Dehalobacter sp. TBBPA1 TaxID=3235037 RepID=UPI0034A37B36
MHFKQIICVTLTCLKKISWKSPRLLGGLFITMILIGSFACYLATPMNAVAVSVNGKQLGLVFNQNTADTLMASAAKEKPYEMAYTNITVSNADYLRSALRPNNVEEKINHPYDAYQFTINGTVIAVLPEAEDIDQVLKEFQAYYVKPTKDNVVTSVKIAEDVISSKTTAGLSQIQSPEQVLKSLIDHNSLTVICQGKYTETQKIQYDTITKKDYKLGFGKKEVITAGSDGSKSVTYSYVQSNGKYSEKQVVKETILQDAVTEVIAEGPTAKPILVASRSNSYSNVVDYALGYVGCPYVYGGISPGGFDCSGFTRYVYAAAGVSLPHSSFAQYASGTPVGRDELQPGDLVFFSTYARGASHVGIYIGGGQYVHAFNYSTGVVVSNLSAHSSSYLGARRY